MSVGVISLQSLDQDYNTLINVLEKESSILIEWFNFNCMQTNPDKFQAIAVGKKIYANKGNNKITELRTILQRESQNS